MAQEKADGILRGSGWLWVLLSLNGLVVFLLLRSGIPLPWIWIELGLSLSYWWVSRRNMVLMLSLMFWGIGAFLVLELLAQKGVLVAALESKVWAVCESLGRTLAAALAVRAPTLNLLGDTRSSREKRN